MKIKGMSVQSAAEEDVVITTNVNTMDLVLTRPPLLESLFDPPAETEPVFGAENVWGGEDTVAGEEAEAEAAPEGVERRKVRARAKRSEAKRSEAKRSEAKRSEAKRSEAKRSEAKRSEPIINSVAQASLTTYILRRRASTWRCALWTRGLVPPTQYKKAPAATWRRPLFYLPLLLSHRD